MRKAVLITTQSKNAIPFSKKMRLRSPCTMEIKMDNTKDQLEILQRQLGLSK
jgi:hypothetical protein